SWGPIGKRGLVARTRAEAAQPRRGVTPKPRPPAWEGRDANRPSPEGARQGAAPKGLSRPFSPRFAYFGGHMRILGSAAGCTWAKPPDGRVGDRIHVAKRSGKEGHPRTACSAVCPSRTTPGTSAADAYEILCRFLPRKMREPWAEGLAVSRLSPI